MPVVLMKTPSPFPFSTTLVSPVTIDTPAAEAAWAMEAVMRMQQNPRLDAVGQQRTQSVGPGGSQSTSPTADHNLLVTLHASVTLSVIVLAVLLAVAGGVLAGTFEPNGAT